jgi:hypothetical protein
VLLKQPGAVPAGAAGLGGAIGEFAPFAWHNAHTAAFASAVVVWTLASLERQLAGCGVLPAPRWQAAFRQVTWDPPPEKSLP